MNDSEKMRTVPVSKLDSAQPLTGSRVLLVSYENDGCAIAELARALQEDGANVYVIVGDQHSLIRMRLWEKRLIENEIPFATLHAVFEEMKTGGVALDPQWIQRFEKERLVTKTFAELMMTDPMLSRQHHHRRPYYKPISAESACLWAERFARAVSEHFDSFNPDFVVTIERNYFVKNAVAQVAMSSGIRVLTYIPCRIGNYGVWVDQFGFAGNCAELFESTTRGRVNDDELSYMREIHSEVNDFIHKEEKGLYAANSQKKRAKRESGATIVRDYCSSEIRSIRRLIAHSVDTVRGKTRRWTTPLAGSFLRIRIFNVLVTYRRLRAQLKGVYDERPTGKSFVIFPLHVMPESSTLTLGPEYYEVDIVRRLSHMMPASMVLVVKENPNMIGLRTKRERDLLRELPNVYYISPWEETSALLRRCAGVAGISGTALLEGALLGKPTLALGRPEFVSALSHVGMSAAPKFFASCQDGTQSRELVEHAYEYIDAMARVAVGGAPASLVSEAKAVDRAAQRGESHIAKVYISLKRCLIAGMTHCQSTKCAEDDAVEQAR